MRQWVLGIVVGMSGSSVAGPLHGPHPTVAHPVAAPSHVVFDNDTKPEVDLRPEIEALGLKVRNQGNRGTCSVFATAFLLEFAYASIGADPMHATDSTITNNLHLSVEYLNWAANVVAGVNYDGAMFSDLVPAYEQYRIVLAGQMPYEPTYNPKHPPVPKPRMIANHEKTERFSFSFVKDWDDTTGYTPAALEAAKNSLRQGIPVALGIWWLATYKTETIHGVELLKEYPRKDNKDPATAPMFDGHSIDLVGFRESPLFPGGGYFVYRNSFGETFGDQGYGYISFQYILDYGNDGIVANTKLTPVPREPPRPPLPPPSPPGEHTAQ